VDSKWKLERKKGIGGSDAAAILGLSPWKSAMDVWLDKLDLAEEPRDPSREFLLTLGTELEPVIARLYEKQTGRQLHPTSAKVHEKYPILRGNPDRLVAGELRGVELKSENQFTDEFGEPGTDQVPLHYLVQCMHYMYVCDYPVWDVALLHGGVAFDIYTIERDPELEREMIDQLLGWWDRHIVQRVPPDIDGSGAWSVYLRKKYPADILPVKEADTETLRLVKHLSAAREIVDKYTGVVDELQNRLKLVIGDHEGIVGDFGKITWRKAKDREEVDWQGAFCGLLETAMPLLEVQVSEANAIVSASTETKPGVRRFLFKQKEGWTYGDPGREQIASGEGFGLPALAGDGGIGGGGASGSDHQGEIHLGGTASERP
jgi:putative phage-type endonuclease